MTVQELINALQGLIAEDDTGQGVTQMEIVSAGNDDWEFTIDQVKIEDGKVWL